MAFVSRYGYTVSEDGWRICDEAECDWAQVPGTDVTLQVRRGVPTTILIEFARRFNERIEPLRDADSACWTPTNDVPNSNHLSGTAMDLNWDSHPFHAVGTYGDRIDALRQLLNEFKGCVWWGGDWTDPVDEMHFQCGFPEGDQRMVDMADEITGQAQPSGPDQVALLIINTARVRDYNRDETIACLSTAIQESNLNPNAVDSTDHRGVYQQDSGYPDRDTLDGQVAGFFDRLDAKRSSTGASPDIWKNIFWLQQRPSEPSAEQAYVNGRQAYLTEIQSRISSATDYYNRLAAAAPSDDWDELMANPELERMIREIHAAWFNKNPSKSRYGDPNLLWGNNQYIGNIDGHVFDLIVEHNAALGDAWSLDAIRKAAAGGDKIAANWLANISATTTSPPATPPPAAPSPQSPPVARPPQPTVPPPVPPPPVPPPAVKPILYCVDGFQSEMWSGPPATVGRALEDVAFFQPVGFDSAAFPLGVGRDSGVAEVKRLIRQHQADKPGRRFAFFGFSLGAVIADDVFDDLRGGDLKEFWPFFLGGAKIGDPRREAHKWWGGPTDPGGIGIAGTGNLRQTPDNFRSYMYDINRGDIYSNAGINPLTGQFDEGIAKDMQLIYDFVLLNWQGGLGGLFAEFTELITRLGSTAIDIIMAIVNGIGFAANQQPHTTYDLTDAIAFLRQLFTTVPAYN